MLRHNRQSGNRAAVEVGPLAISNKAGRGPHVPGHESDPGGHRRICHSPLSAVRSEPLRGGSAGIIAAPTESRGTRRCSAPWSLEGLRHSGTPWLRSSQPEGSGLSSRAHFGLGGEDRADYPNYYPNPATDGAGLRWTSTDEWVPKSCLERGQGGQQWTPRTAVDGRDSSSLGGASPK